MEIAPLSQLRSCALRNIFSQEREEWARSLSWDYREPQRVLCAMIDAAVLPGFVALEQGGPVGYAFHVEERSTGLIGGCFVSKSHEGRGIEEQLLSQVLRKLMSSPTIDRIESQFISFRHWAIDEFFVRNSFSRFNRCFMRRGCEPAPAPRPSSSFAIKSWSPQDLEQAVQLTVATYQAVIDRQISCHYQSAEACREYLNNLVFRPGCGVFLPEASYCARDLATDELIGYVLTSRISPRDGHVPQIVISARHQGRGAGSGLLARAVRYLGLNGYQTVSLTVTENNHAAMSLYRRFGFSIQLRFPAFVWLNSG